ncbi:MAG: hypothetical protein NZM43_00675 [Saprospiraceae bacterium]|nr:hypothetical protein [Saprospiraceae bacterium]MDW8482816.1 hypothetical protein [Saprospiraceae bacterium]
MSWLKYAALTLLLSFASGCDKPTSRGRILAFFYWKNRLALTPAEVAFLDSLGCQVLYVKFLDIARVGGEPARPYSILEVIDTTGLGNRVIVPCVFLTNSVFEGLSTAEGEVLAQKVARAISRVGQQFPKASFAEVQVDCDWTKRTRHAYFLFLDNLRKCLPAGTKLSATLRLHQYKFPHRTGVPPVERGLLMLYNTGDIQDPNEENSIFSYEDAFRYLDGAPAHYPLPLDVALPAFSWTLVYRDGHLWKIGPEGYRPPPYDGEQRVRTERIDTALLRKAAQLAAHVRTEPGSRLAFFRLDSTTVRQFSIGFLREIVTQVSD